MIACGSEIRWEYGDGGKGNLKEIRITFPEGQTLLQIEESIKHNLDHIQETYKDRLTRELANKAAGL
jgi:hypothetical protein